MNLYTIDTGYFKLDGGSMFGIVPKTIWQNLNPADANNRSTWAMRCLLIEIGKRLILVDTGMGDKQEKKFMAIFEPHGDDTLKGSLKKHGFSPADVTDVLLTHLHFDHCGGAIDRVGDKLEAAFPNAVYWSSSRHWNWAINPNPREKSSFLKENILPLKESGRLKFTETENMAVEGLEIEYVHGHTESMMVCHISGYKGRSVSYAADLIPSRHHIPMPYVMAYDNKPMESTSEKAAFLRKVIDRNGIVMFEHDHDVECCTLTQSEKGIIFKDTFPLSDI